jgi:hypothetical protein
MSTLSTVISDEAHVKRFLPKTTTFDAGFIGNVNERLARIAPKRRVSFSAFLEAAGAELLELDDETLIAVLAKHAARQRRST